tara:strand:- start:375 stop:1307 length:933 start_codon:yes stop_codon:yes gene_type:complete
MKSIPLCCPCCKQNIKQIEKGLICLNKNCEHNKLENAFPIVNSVPILISENLTDTICSVEAGKVYIKRPLSKFKKLKSIIVGESRVTKLNCLNFLNHLNKISDKPKILVIGGGEKGSGTDNLWYSEKIEIDSVDIYASDSVDVVCDGHYLPLKDNSYDGVWIQAVIEHVVEPTVVAEEIFRVLKIGGLVYAETPFMQQVHEGAYDFTRYTVVGHRFLFKKFKSISYGGLGGPEVVFAWAIRYLIWSLTRSRNLSRVIGLAIGFILRPLAFFVSKKSMFDASSGVYFLGKKEENYKISHKDLLKTYKGQFK